MWPIVYVTRSFVRKPALCRRSDIFYQIPHPSEFKNISLFQADRLPDRISIFTCDIDIRKILNHNTVLRCIKAELGTADCSIYTQIEPSGLYCRRHPSACHQNIAELPGDLVSRGHFHEVDPPTRLCAGRRFTNSLRILRLWNSMGARRRRNCVGTLCCRYCMCALQCSILFIQYPCLFPGLHSIRLFLPHHMGRNNCLFIRRTSRIITACSRVCILI